MRILALNFRGLILSNRNLFVKPFLLLCILATSLGGCGSREPVPDAQGQFSPPAGFTIIKSLPSGAPVGTPIYSVKGNLAGTIVGYEPNHEFANGPIALGVSVRLPNVPQPIWMSERDITKRFFLKEK